MNIMPSRKADDKPRNATELLSQTEELLTFLEASEAHPLYRKGTNIMVDTNQFDGAMTFGDVFDAWGGMMLLPNEKDNEDPKNWVSWPLDSAMCTTHLHDDWQEGSWGFYRARTCHPKEARGKASLIAPKMLAYDRCFITPDGMKRGVRTYASFAGGKWVPAGKTPSGGIDDTDYNNTFRLFSSVGLLLRYNWSVCLGFGGPTVRFLTDPVGAREIFKLRDVPEGKTRRAALRHWVSQHYRKRRTDKVASAEVRKHLRGSTGFLWNGMRCQIQPSLIDIEENSLDAR